RKMPAGPPVSTAGICFSVAAARDGTHSFSATATDTPSLPDAPPAYPDASTVLDATAPASKASAPALTNSATMTVSYTAADNAGGTGLAQVDLYARAPGQSAYSKVASDTSGSA